MFEFIILLNIAVVFLICLWVRMLQWLKLSEDEHSNSKDELKGVMEMCNDKECENCELECEVKKMLESDGFDMGAEDE